LGIGAAAFYCATVAILARGIEIGRLEVPLRHTHLTVAWANNPTGFVLLVALYLALAALFGWLAYFNWRARRHVY